VGTTLANPARAARSVCRQLTFDADQKINQISKKPVANLQPLNEIIRRPFSDAHHDFDNA
jgi:hypothetical protein